jgi:carboxypeptidase-like protein/TonB-dependent receptor-like protein
MTSWSAPEQANAPFPRARARARVLRLVLLLLGLAAPAAGYGAATIQGVVASKDEGQGVPYAVVRVLGTAIRAETANDGAFSLHGVPAGPNRIGVSLVGFRPLLDSLFVSESDTLLNLRLELEPVAFALNEVVVRAEPPGAESHAQVLSTEQIRRIPATFEDLFRGVQVLPGIAAPDVSASFLVRGGESDETLVRLDGIDLLEPYHIRDWGGALSAVSLEAAESARLQRGGLPARYGRQLSGSLEIDTPGPDPTASVLHVAASLTQLRAAYSARLGENSSLLVGARHGLLAAVYRTHRFDPNTNVEPDFQDLFAELRVRPGPRQELVFLALATRDHLRYDESFDQNDIEGPTHNVTTGIRWSARPADGVRTLVAVSGDYFDRRRTLGHTGRDDSITRAVRMRGESEVTLSGSQSLEAGVGAEWEDGRIRFDTVDAYIQNGIYTEDLITQTAGTAVRHRLDGFLSLHSRWGSNLSTTAGVNVARDRYDWGLQRDGQIPESNAGGSFASPRLSVGLRLGGGATLRAAAGLLRQPTFLNYLTADRVQVPLGRRREAEEAILGIDLRPSGAQVRVEGYVRRDRGVGFPIQDQAPRPPLDPPLDRGHARGVEVFLQSPPWKPCDAWIGYALSRAEWETETGDVPRSFDQRHSITASMNVHPLGQWNFNATGRYHTGGAYTSFYWTSPDGRYNWSQGFGSFMGGRYPDYFRLDLRVTHPLGIGRPGGRFYVELINATGRENVYFYTYDFDPYPGGGSYPTRYAIDLFPRLPSVGVELSF